MGATEATQDRVGMIPRDWHRELKMTTLACGRPGAAGVCAADAWDC